jgi:hypothetical protein
MKKKYDCVVTVGCSFVAGSNILGANQEVDQTQRASAILAKELGVPEINLAKPGGGNQYIVRTAYDWVTNNIKYTNPLIIIGTSGTARKEFQSVETGRHYDLHIFDFQFSKPSEKRSENYEHALARRAEVISPHLTTEDFDRWLRVETEFMFNDTYELERANRNYNMLFEYIKSKGYTLVYFNSLMDVLGSLKDDVNFVSFNMEEGKEYNMNDFGSKQKQTLNNCWYHYLRQQHSKKNYDFNDESSRSSTPPHGEFFCGSHPSSKANRHLVDLIKEKI